MSLKKAKQKCKFCGVKVLKSKICHIDGFPCCKKCFEKKKNQNYYEREGIPFKLRKKTWLDDWVVRLQKKNKSISKQLKEKKE